jgi:hypothetical protein
MSGPAARESITVKNRVRKTGIAAPVSKGKKLNAATPQSAVLPAPTFWTVDCSCRGEAGAQKLLLFAVQYFEASAQGGTYSRFIGQKVSQAIEDGRRI